MCGEGPAYFLYVKVAAPPFDVDTVAFCVCVLSCSCQASIVYVPADHRVSDDSGGCLQPVPP